MRFSIHEYGIGIELDSLVDSTHSRDEIARSVVVLNTRVKKSIGSDTDVIVIQNNRIRALRIAGIVRLCNDIELEIVPKFIDSSTSGWRETFYFLSLISKYGRLMDSIAVGSDLTFIESFYEIAGMVLADEYQRFHREPIRLYHTRTYRDFSWSGEVDPESLNERNPGGFLQTESSFSIHNEFNSTIVKAMQIVLPYVHDSRSRSVMRRLLTGYGSCEDYSKRRKSVPRRNKEWVEAYSIAFDIIQGMTIGLDTGRNLSCEFVVNTWRAWEWLVSLGLSIGCEGMVVRDHILYDWMDRMGGGDPLQVCPDVSVFERGTKTPAFLIDAKYKDVRNEVDRSDLYEAVAFCRGSHSNTIVLVYPDQSSDESPGTVRFRRGYEIDGALVYQVSVVIDALTTNQGLGKFGKTLSIGIREVISK